MVVPRLIERKRDGGALEPREWRELVARYTAGEVPDYQMSALLMAVMFRGLEAAELAALTEAMLASGDRLERVPGGPPRVDKHSTGGVGDKTSLLLAPLLAAAGVEVPMMSGRGLGHTGGTLDKLEAIPGFSPMLSLDQVRHQLQGIGAAMFGQTDEIVPADRKLYALRDVTGTVESVPLITASIMSKKLAEGLDGLVLDVKVGSGAFLPEAESARTLARTMVRVGEASGCRTVALLTAMDRPLGRCHGNALEVREAIAGLDGEGPDDVMTLTLTLGVEMLLLAGVTTEADQAASTLRGLLASGAAREAFRRIIAAQGGDPRVIDDPGLLPRAPVILEVHSSAAGAMPPLPPRPIGETIVALGGGRRTAEDRIDPAVGIELLPRPGEQVSAGDVVALVHARDAASGRVAVDRLAGVLAGAWEEGAVPLPLVVERLTPDDATPYGGMPWEP
jgi:pyrimidine-nucleoside phosphorylase